jgi:hypothetical protein
MRLLSRCDCCNCSHEPRAAISLLPTLPHWWQVRVLLDNVAPRSPGSWENKVHDPQRCGLTKAVCAADGSYEWVEPRWRESYERRGRALLGDGAAEA